MAAEKYLQYDATTGAMVEKQAVSAGGSGNAGQILALDGDGLVPTTALPDDAEEESIRRRIAVEDVDAGKLYANTADGWVLFDIDSHLGRQMGYADADGYLTLFGPVDVTSLATLERGKPVCTSDTPGEIVSGVPTDYNIAVVGYAEDTLTLMVLPYGAWGGDTI